jgi:uncharacterized membrane protein
MVFEVSATMAAGLFSGAALYVNLVEHPARMQCGTDLAVKEFAPSYRRAATLQVFLAIVGLLMAAAAWMRGGSIWWLVGGVILIAVIPFTVLVILPTNHQLLEPSLAHDSELTSKLLVRWGRLHAIRTILGLISFLIFALIPEHRLP